VDSAVVGSFTVVVSPVDDAPIATAQTVGVVEETATAITLAGTDSENESLTYEVLTQPTKGVLSGTAPALTYTPTLNLTGADSFTFRVKDAGLTSSVATVSIVITNVNDVPVATAQTVTTDEDTAKAITLAGTDADGNALTYTVVTQPTKGVLSGTAPALTYTPNANLNGADSFTFKVNDGTVDSSVATVSITINPVNDIPVATNAVVGLLEDAVSVPVTLTGNSPEGRSITFQVLTLPTKGTFGGAAPNLTYTPALNQAGTDSFTFKVNDGVDNSGVATVTLNITNVNDLPSFTIPTSVKPGGDASSWTKLGAANASWNGLALSTNGNVLVAASDTVLTISTDGGATSTNAVVGGTDSFNAVAVTANGSKVLVARGTQLFGLPTPRARPRSAPRPETLVFGGLLGRRREAGGCGLRREGARVRPTPGVELVRGGLNERLVFGGLLGRRREAGGCGLQRTDLHDDRRRDELDGSRQREPVLDVDRLLGRRIEAGGDGSQQGRSTPTVSTAVRRGRRARAPVRGRRSRCRPTGSCSWPLCWVASRCTTPTTPVRAGARRMTCACGVPWRSRPMAAAL
jgi:hypothetical protein